MSESEAPRVPDANEITQKLRRLRPRFDEFRGRL